MLRKFVFTVAFSLLVASATLAQSGRHFTFHYAFTVKNVPEGRTRSSMVSRCAL